MRHPFDLNDSELEALDLDFEEELTEEESAQVGGGLSLYTTRALGEEGGGFPKPIPFPFPKPIPFPEPEPHPPIATTLAIGEEGGDDFPVTTLAIGEEGGDYPIC